MARLCQWLLAAVALSLALAGAAAATAPGTRPRGVRLALGRPGELLVRWLTAAPMAAPACIEMVPEQTKQQQQQQGRQPSGGPDWADRRQLVGGAGGGRLEPPCSGVGVGACGAEPHVLCGSSSPFVEPSLGWPTMWLHEVAWAGWGAGAYSYRCGSAADGWSGWRRARLDPGLLPPPWADGQGRPVEQVEVLVFGDLGLARGLALPDLVAAAQQGGDAAQGGPAAALHLGDLAYDLQDAHGAHAVSFLDSIDPLASALPYLTVPGNHESHFGFAHYRALFGPPPALASGSARGLYYSFDLGPVHLLAYNTEAFFFPESFVEQDMREMVDWMRRDLQAAAANREAVPWIVAAGHRPMYCARTGAAGRCSWEAEASRRGLPSKCPGDNPRACRSTGSSSSFPVEALFHEFGVDLALYGHVHAYERMRDVFELTPGGAAGLPGVECEAPTATVHVTTGGAGNREMRSAGAPPPRGPCNATAPWCVFQSGSAPALGQAHDFGYGRLQVANTTHLRWSQYSSTAGSTAGFVDDWWLVVPRHGPFGSHVPQGAAAAAA